MYEDNRFGLKITHLLAKLALVGVRTQVGFLLT